MRGVRTVLVAAGLFAAAAAGFGNDEIKLGDPFKAQMALEMKAGKGGFGGPGGPVASHSVEVRLKAGQKVEAAVAVTGEDRKCGVAVVAPDGNVIGTSWTNRGGDLNPRTAAASFGSQASSKKKAGGALGKTAKLTIAEVPATGKYTVLVFSNLAGDYTLLVGDGAKPAGRDAAAIRKELEDARKRVADLEQELREKEKNEKPDEVSGPRPVNRP